MNFQPSLEVTPVALENFITNIGFPPVTSFLSSKQLEIDSTIPKHARFTELVDEVAPLTQEPSSQSSYAGLLSQEVPPDTDRFVHIPSITYRTQQSNGISAETNQRKKKRLVHGSGSRLTS